LRVLVSLHDVTPAHQARLEQAEGLFARVGVGHVAYLLIPNYHHRRPIAGDAAFRAWCARPRPYAVDWVLHGFYHLEDLASATVSGPITWARRKTMTASEGEFLSLGVDEQRRRIADGQAAAQSIGIAPSSFVAPAWLFNRHLVPTLAEAGFAYTEDHVHVIDVKDGTKRRCPAITWATRTTFRRAGSRVVCPVLFSMWKKEPAIRIALHPFDMDHPHTADQVERLLARALEQRTCGGYAELFLE
jgi:predicted deacetylase